MKLTNSIEVNGQEMDILVEYNSATNTVEEILSVSMTSCGNTVDVSDLMMNFFENELNKIINDIDWRDIWISNVVDNALK